MSHDSDVQIFNDNRYQTKSHQSQIRHRSFFVRVDIVSRVKMLRAGGCTHRLSYHHQAAERTNTLMTVERELNTSGP